MAFLFAKAVSGDVSLSASTAKTVLSIKAPTNQKVAIKGLHIECKGTANTDTPIVCQLKRITTDGTGTALVVGTNLCLNNDGDQETIQTSGKINYTAEPTYSGAIVDQFDVHPQTSRHIYLPFEMPIMLKGGGMIGLQCTAGQSETVSATFEIEE